MDKQILHIAALNLFEGKLREESAILDETFDILDACVEKLELVDTPLSWIAGHTLRKAGSTSLGLYKMILDGGISERRVHSYSLIESLELLVYIGNRAHLYDPVPHAKSPAAGETANGSTGRYKLLWYGLNTRAVQLGFSYESLLDVFPIDRENCSPDQPQELEILKSKLKIFYRVMIRLILEGANCISLMSSHEESIFFERLHSHIEQSHALFGTLGEESNLPTENVA